MACYRNSQLSHIELFENEATKTSKQLSPIIQRFVDTNVDAAAAPIMAKHKISDHRKTSRMFRNENLPTEVMSLDESETLLGNQYATTSAHQPLSPCITIVELGTSGPPLCAGGGGGGEGIGRNLAAASISAVATASVAAGAGTFGNKRLPSMSSVATPSPFTEQTTITSTGLPLLERASGPHEWGEATRSYVKSQRRAGRATFQGQVYNFLERPVGWKCIIYHVLV